VEKQALPLQEPGIPLLYCPNFKIYLSGMGNIIRGMEDERRCPTVDSGSV
jgi:hypothetical protein